MGTSYDDRGNITDVNKQSYSTLAPLLNRIKGFEQRHKSVAPKYKAAAQDRSLYFSPSNMTLGLKDQIYDGSSPR